MKTSAAGSPTHKGRAEELRAEGGGGSGGEFPEMPFSPTSEGFEKSRNKSFSGCRRPPKAVCGTSWSRGGSGGWEAQGGGCGEGGQT